MIDNANWLDVLGVLGVALGVYGAIKLYMSWWLASPRATRTAARIKTRARRAEFGA